MPISVELVGDKGNAGKTLVRSVGEKIEMFPCEIDFSDVTNYSPGGEEIDFNNYFNVDVIAAVVTPKDGYIFEYDEENEKVEVLYPTIEHDHGTGDETQSASAAEEVEENADISSLGKIRAIVYGY